MERHSIAHELEIPPPPYDGIPSLDGEESSEEDIARLAQLVKSLLYLPHAFRSFLSSAPLAFFLSQSSLFFSPLEFSSTLFGFARLLDPSFLLRFFLRFSLESLAFLFSASNLLASQSLSGTSSRGLFILFLQKVGPGKSSSAKRPSKYRK